jgi:glycosyltransferase involved in cell wall biosynthesis
MKIALIHYWLTSWRGGELVLRDVSESLKNYEVDIYTHVYDSALKKNFGNHVNIKTTFINKLPFAKKIHQLYILLMPIALKRINLDEYDLIISFESGPAKGIKTKYNHKHLCYVHSPMRYIWDMHDEYIEAANFFEKLFLKFITPFLQVWDLKTSKYPKTIYCNSKFVKKRIKKYWKRNATVFYPAIDSESSLENTQDDDYYLFIGELNHYKKADLIFDTFIKNDRKIKIIGKGKYLSQFQKNATNNIEILGRVDDSKKNDLLKNCSALIFPGTEDFGLVPLEAMSWGKPVIGFRAGGLMETVVEDKTGIFFDKQDPQSLNEALDKFEMIKDRFKSDEILLHANTFSLENFKNKWKIIVQKELKNDV